MNGGEWVWKLDSGLAGFMYNDNNNNIIIKDVCSTSLFFLSWRVRT